MRGLHLISTLAALLTLVLPEAPRAQTATLRSGDHSDFTRLTITLPPNTDWDLNQASRRLQLSLSGAVQAINTQSAFDRITRDRIAQINTISGPGLDIRLNCDCTASGQMGRNNLLIIDVRDGARLALARPTGALPAGRTLRLDDGTTRLGFNRAADADAAPAGIPMSPPPARRPQPMPEVRPTAAPAPPPSAEAPPLPPLIDPQGLIAQNREYAREAVSALPAVDPVSEEVVDMTAGLETQLLEAIGRAASEGLLEINPALQPPAPPASEDALPRTGPDPGLSATPSSLEAMNSANRDRYLLSGDPCALQMPPLTTGDLEDDFMTRLGQLRSALTGEFDRDNADAYRDLASFYLRHGFGAEASRAVESVPMPERIKAEMQSVGRILEQGHDPEGGPFPGRESCDGEAAIWAVLSQARLPAGTDFDGPAIKMAMTLMPTALKTYVGPLLADRFTGAQEPEFAQEIMRIVARDTEEQTSQRDLAEARIATARDGQADRDAYDALIARNDEVSAEALLHLANETLRNGAAVDPETIGLLESYRGQYREGPVAARLIRTEILARASSGGFPAAFALLRQEGPALDPETVAMITDRITAQLAATADDTPFVRLFFENEMAIAVHSSAETGNMVAERLLGLGFTDAASRLLAPGAGGDPGRKRRLLRAQVALANVDPLSAEAELAGLTGSDVDALRAEARLLSQDFTGARNLYEATGQEDRARDAAFLGRDWQALQAEPPSPVTRLADVVSEQQASPVPLPVAGPPTLAASRDVLSQSGDTRAALQELLSTLQVDTALEN